MSGGRTATILAVGSLIFLGALLLYREKQASEESERLRIEIRRIEQEADEKVRVLQQRVDELHRETLELEKKQKEPFVAPPFYRPPPPRHPEDPVYGPVPPYRSK